MSKRTSGLGKGLEDLLNDNAPEIRLSGTVIRRDEDGDVSVSHQKQKTDDILKSAGALENTENKTLTVKNDEKYANFENTDIDVTDDGEKKTVLIHGGTSSEDGTADEPLKNTRSLKALFRSYK